MAAGVSLLESQLEPFRAMFSDSARLKLDTAALTPLMKIDAEVKLKDITHEFLEIYRLLEPFGQKNSEPLFLCKGVTPRLPGRVMREKHLRVMLTQEGAQMDARWFNAPIGNLPPPPWDVAMRLSRNWFRGQEEWQVGIEAVRTSE